MVAIKTFLFAAVASASAVVPRDYTTIQNDLTKIDSLTNTVTQKANAYNGGVSNAIPIQTASNNLDDYIKNTATPNANKSGVLTSANAQKVISYITNTLEPDVLKSVNAIIAKKSKFAADGLTSSVKSSFTTLKTDTDAYGAALLKKTPSAQQSSAKSAQAKIDADLQKGINAFS